MIKSYEKNGQKLYEVAIFVKDSKRKQHSRKRKGIASKREAEKIEFQFKKELSKFTDETFVNWTWKEWHQEALKRMKLNRKSSTIKSYDGGLKKWLPRNFTEMPLDKIKAQDVHELLFEEIGVRASTPLKKHTLKLIRRIFEMAVEEGLIARNPTNGIQIKAPKGRKKVLNSEEAGILLREAFSVNHRFYDVWAFALMTGMRSGEMFALTWRDIDLSANLISVNKQWTSKDGIALPKNREDRVVPINDDLRELLQSFKAQKKFHRGEYLDSRSGNVTRLDDLVLPRLNEWQNGEQAMVLRDFLKSIDLPPVKFHDLRATFITNMLAQGVPLVQVMAIVGHRRMSTTDEYLRLAGVSIRGATGRIGYALPKENSTSDNVVELAAFRGPKVR